MTYIETITTAAKALKVSSTLLVAICTHESGGLKNVLVPHDHGSTSFGVCQVKFQTAKMLGFKGQEQDLMNVETNAKVAAQYLKYQMRRYNDNACMSVAAYNAGSFSESKKLPGKPRNLRYVRLVQAQLPISERYLLSCNLSEVALQNE